MAVAAAGSTVIAPDELCGETVPMGRGVVSPGAPPAVVTVTMSPPMPFCYGRTSGYHSAVSFSCGLCGISFTGIANMPFGLSFPMNGFFHVITVSTDLDRLIGLHKEEKAQGENSGARKKEEG
jgi:hypothetical protein